MASLAQALGDTPFGDFDVAITVATLAILLYLLIFR